MFSGELLRSLFNAVFFFFFFFFFSRMSLYAVILAYWDVFSCICVCNAVVYNTVSMFMYKHR